MTVDTPLECDTERHKHAVPYHQQGRRQAGVPRGEGQISRDQDRHRGGKDDEIASGQQEAARGRTATC